MGCTAGGVVGGGVSLGFTQPRRSLRMNEAVFRASQRLLKCTEDINARIEPCVSIILALQSS